MKQVLITVLAMLAMVGIAQAQGSNSLDNALDNPPTNRAEMYDELRGAGYIFYKPEETMAKLSEAGFQIVNKAERPNGDIIYTTVAGQQLFAWAFLECVSEECFIFRPVYIMPVSALGLRLTPADANRLNADSPVGYFLVSEQGDIILRNSLLALPECSSNCQDQALLQFISAARTANQIIGRMLNQKTAGVDQSSSSSVTYRQLAGTRLPRTVTGAEADQTLQAHIASRAFGTEFADLPFNFDLEILVYGGGPTTRYVPSVPRDWPALEE